MRSLSGSSVFGRVDLALVAVSLFSAVTLAAAVTVTRASDGAGSAPASLSLDEDLAAAAQRPTMSYDEALRILATWAVSAGAPAAPGVETAPQATQTLAAFTAGAAIVGAVEPELQPVAPGGSTDMEPSEAPAREEVVLLHTCSVDPESEQCRRGDRVTYQPATEGGDPPAVCVHMGPAPTCTAVGGSALAHASSRELRAHYLNAPAALVADGFTVTVVPGTRWFFAAAMEPLTDGKQLVAVYAADATAPSSTWTQLGSRDRPLGLVRLP